VAYEFESADHGMDSSGFYYFVDRIACPCSRYTPCAASLGIRPTASPVSFTPRRMQNPCAAVPLDFEIEQSGTAPILLRPIDYGADIVVHSLTLGGHGTQRIKRSCTTYSRTAIAGFAPAISCGDTFRWKGENVATSEVAAAIMAFSGITEANVYGVRVPGNEGAAGMAAIVPDGWLDVAALRAHLAQRLPAYARPKFLRVAKELAKTSTFKHTKNDLQRDGFDPAATRDTIYFDDPASDAFVPLDQALYERIKTGVVRF
jgi:acyl-CoA synthetase (AMP-forming)/AMP-acid ligase II